MASSDDHPRHVPVFTLRFPYGFIDEVGTHQFWRAGQQVSDPADLDLLRARGVALMED